MKPSRRRKGGVTAESLAEITRKIMSDSNSYYIDNFNCRIYRVHENYLHAVLDVCAMSLSQHLRRICRQGGVALNAKLTPEQRGASARHAARARWAKEKEL